MGLGLASRPAGKKESLYWLADWLAGGQQAPKERKVATGHWSSDCAAWANMLASRGGAVGGKEREMVAAGQEAAEAGGVAT